MPNCMGAQLNPTAHNRRKTGHGPLQTKCIFDCTKPAPPEEFPPRAQVPAEIVQQRYERLTALVEETTYAENRKQAGGCVEVLVAEGEGRKDAATHRMSGRARDNRLVHFTPAALPPSPGAPRPGDVVTVTVTRGAPHYLLSDAPPLSLRRTRAGDAWAAATASPPSASPATTSHEAPVLLGMPARHPLG